MNRLLRRAAIAAIAVVSLVPAAGAVTLSTGAGPLGGTEPGWALTSSPGSLNLTIVSSAQDYPGAWVTAPVGSNWITPYAGGGTTATSEAPDGTYVYSLNFGNPGTNVPIQWSSDNGAEFRLNGNLLGTTGSQGYLGLNSILINAVDFLAFNTFTVTVQNEHCEVEVCHGLNPTGLLVSIPGLAAPAATPLPAALPLFATGLGALGLIGWRRKKKAAALAA